VGDPIAGTRFISFKVPLKEVRPIHAQFVLLYISYTMTVLVVRECLLFLVEDERLHLIQLFFPNVSPASFFTMSS
jgi:hypothetical protein